MKPERKSSGTIRLRTKEGDDSRFDLNSIKLAINDVGTKEGEDFSFDLSSMKLAINDVERKTRVKTSVVGKNMKLTRKRLIEKLQAFDEEFRVFLLDYKAKKHFYFGWVGKIWFRRYQIAGVLVEDCSYMNNEFYEKHDKVNMRGKEGVCSGSISNLAHKIPLDLTVDDNFSDESMSPVSSGEGEVVNDESPMKEETSQGGATSSVVSSEDTVDDDNGTNNLRERLEKPIRLICLVISIYAGAAFVLGKNNRRR